jgi:hypothetical protein
MLSFIFLNIFHTGGLTLGLTIVWLILAGIFGFQSYYAHHSEDGFYGTDGQWVKLGDKTPWFKIIQFKAFVAVTILYVVVMIIVASDYKGV